MVTLLRALAGLVLGMVVFAGLLYSLVVVNFSQRLEDPEVYNVAISDTDAYNRVYDDVLVDEALAGQTAKLMGDLDIEANEEAVEVLRDVLPPAYLQEQTEKNVERFTGFLRHDRENLEIYLALKEPLERIEPAVLDKVHQIIDELVIEEPTTSGCSLGTLQRLAAESAKPFAQLSDGELPESSPSLRILSTECRQQEFDSWFDLVLDDPAMNSQAALILDSRREEIRGPFIAGDTRAFLKAVADPLVEPLIEDAIADIRRNLQGNDRFDALQWMADESDDLTREDIEEQADTLRDVVSGANGSGRIIALLMVALGCLLMALVHLPKPGEMLRWPGITLLMGSGVCLGVGFVLNSAIPGQIRKAITNAASYSADVPISAIDLSGDLMESFARQVTAGFMPAAVTVMVLGVVLIVASLFAGALMAVARRLLPSSGSNGRSR
jgi:hypothetical protein